MKKKPSANEHKGLVKAKRKAGGLRVQYTEIFGVMRKVILYFGGC